MPITMNSTLAVDRNDTPVDCIGRQPLLHVQQIIHYLGEYLTTGRFGQNLSLE